MHDEYSWHVFIVLPIRKPY